MTKKKTMFEASRETRLGTKQQQQNTENKNVQHSPNKHQKPRMKNFIVKRIPNRYDETYIHSKWIALKYTRCTFCTRNHFVCRLFLCCCCCLSLVLGAFPIHIPPDSPSLPIVWRICVSAFFFYRLLLYMP